jgi:hypothetical protein
VLNIVSGTWTPGLSSTSPGDLAPNISSSSGTYSQFGNQVTIDFTMTLAPTFTTATGNMRVTGLPLAAGSHGFNYAINAGYPCGPLTLPTNNYAFSFSLAGGNTFLAVISQGRGVTSGPLAINQALTSGGTITLSGNGTYRL